MLPDSAAVEPLLAEQDALRGWLARLDEAGTAVPEAVRARVRADYLARLAGVTDRLRDHADTIAARLAEDRAEHAAKVALLDTAEQELAEAQLRHAVGEYDATRFASEQARFGDDIIRHRMSRDAAQERIDRWESIHALIQGPVRGAPATDAAAPEPVAAVVDADESALLSVFDEPTAPADDANAPLSFRPGSGLVADHTRVMPRRPIPPTPTPIGLPVAPPPSFAAPLDPSPAAVPASDPEVVSAPEPESEPEESLFGDEPIVATGATSPAAAPVDAPAPRTVRCGECGAMNTPKDWYCEQCGAELNTT